MSIPPDFRCEYADRPGVKCGPCDMTTTLAERDALEAHQTGTCDDAFCIHCDALREWMARHS